MEKCLKSPTGTNILHKRERKGILLEHRRDHGMARKTQGKKVNIIRHNIKISCNNIMTNQWIQHEKNYASDNSITYKEAMKKAKESYKSDNHQDGEHIKKRNFVKAFNDKNILRQLIESYQAKKHETQKFWSSKEKENDCTHIIILFFQGIY